jgi:hypothetical protein
MKIRAAFLFPPLNPMITIAELAPAYLLRFVAEDRLNLNPFNALLRILWQNDLAHQKVFLFFNRVDRSPLT